MYSYMYRYIYRYLGARKLRTPLQKDHVHSAHGGDQTQNIWISRSIRFPDRSFELRQLRLLT